MKQVVQNFKTGELAVREVPMPHLVGPGVLVRTHVSLVSAGTERMVTEFAQKSMVGKARSRPDLVRQVLDKIKRDGLLSTFRTVMSRLEQELPLGYSSAGTVIAQTPDVEGLSVGDRVACAGGNYATHSEAAFVPKNLIARIPEGVSFEEASFVTLGAIAMQGVRVADVRLGERVGVIGLGLLGLLTVQLLKASGCRVLGVDVDASRVELARTLGADVAVDPNAAGAAARSMTEGRGLDAVIITAATASNQPIEQAAEMSRLKGRVAIVGAVGMNIPRKPYYERELDIRFSMSYGPGRYDTNYEEKGRDYPYAYVPFTEQRNMIAFLDLIAQGTVDVKTLITHRIPIDEAHRAYDMIQGKGQDAYIAICLTYPQDRDLTARIELPAARSAPVAGKLRVAFIGAGNYAQLMLLPRFAAHKDLQMVGVATHEGVGARQAAEKFGFRYATTDYREVLADGNVDAVVIATRHDLHAQVAVEALQAGKHVWVEKPLGLNEEELAEVVEAARAACDRVVFVGFNRRWAPLTQEAVRFFAGRRGPMSILYRCNAGALPPEHWAHDSEVGGGRIIGEACHFIDLVAFLAGAMPTSVYCRAVAGLPQGQVNQDQSITTVTLADGSIGSVAYLASGEKSFSKERIEVFADGKTFVIDDFRLGLAAASGREKHFKMTQDKGQSGEVDAFVRALRAGGEPPIPLADLIGVHLATLKAIESLRSGVPLDLGLSLGAAEKGD
jgi:predicted dehydrogenase/threonine dehydrogenase-like Zn-dependent dehydrogenase